jgi:PTS system fructose-specific IIC component
MKITELLTKETVLLSIEGNEKHTVINELIDLLDRAGKLFDKEQFKASILKREEQGSTGFSDGIAIPHAKDFSVKKAAIAFGKSMTGVDFEAIDGQPSHLFFMIAVPEGANQTHLEVLSRLAVILLKEVARQKLITASTVDDILNTIDYFDDVGEKKEEVLIMDQKNFLVAVRSCPTGISHT